MKTAWKKIKVSASVLALAGVLQLMAREVRAAEWRIDTVDESGAAKFTSMKIDRDGNIHVAYIPEAEGHPLRYAFWDHQIKRWFTMTVTQVASFCTLTLDSKQHPHIAFADHGTGLGSELRHAWWDGDSWKVDAITVQYGAVVAYYTSIVLDRNDNPVFAFYDYADPGNNFRLRMRSVFWMGKYWEVRTVDQQGGSGKFNSLAMDSAGRPHLAYANVKYESSSLRYAVWDGQAWKTEYLEGAPGTACPTASVAMILDAKDTPHITYTLPEKRLVKYATKVDGKWNTYVVDAIRQDAYPDRNGIALDSQGTPYVSYFDAGTGELKLAHRKDGKWLGEIIDQNYAGFTSSLVIDRDTIWISYGDELGRSLKVASRRLEQGRASRQQDSLSASKVK
jgi:hypothetical protein